MITLTENATQQIKKVIESQGAHGKALRVYVEQGCCSGPRYGLAFDAQQSGDEVVQHDGVQVVIDPDSAMVLNGSTIDYVVSAHGEGFQIKNPNAQKEKDGSCGHGGCGCSH